MRHRLVKPAASGGQGIATLQLFPADRAVADGNCICCLPPSCFPQLKVMVPLMHAFDHDLGCQINNSALYQVGRWVSWSGGND